MTQSNRLITPVLIGGGLILMVSFGARASFGVFQIPISQDLGWLRIEYSLALAIQNLAWGIGQPIFGAIAEKFGNRLALILGGIVYFLGMVLSANSISPEAHQVYGVLIGMGVAGTGFGVIFGMVGRAASDEHRSMALAIATAIGSLGQIIGPPLAGYLLVDLHWSEVFWIFGFIVLASLLVLPMMKTPTPEKQANDEPMGTAIWRSVKDPSFVLIFIGFFSCGYQIGFFTSHFPAMVTELCGPIASDGILASLGVSTTAQLGAWSIGLIGMANIIGTLVAGKLGGKYSKKYLLSSIYFGRVIVCVVFILTPITPATVILFSIMMGMLWLATVPLTSGLIGHIYGVRYMGTLYGLVFFSHQLGGFAGIWLGGALYDSTGGYDLVWWIGIGVGAFSALVHLPIQERPRAVAAA